MSGSCTPAGRAGARTGRGDPPVQVVLASASPRRARLLAQAGIRYLQLPPSVDEAPLPGETAGSRVRRLALAKARAIPGDRPVLGADTVVVAGSAVYGKPRGHASYLAMMKRLSGSSHRVLTAVALRHGDREEVRVAEAEVTFRCIGVDEMTAYWATGEPRDKAGGYGIQGIGAIFVAGIRGSYSAVVGLPLAETEILLASFGIDTWRWRRQDRCSSP